MSDDERARALEVFEALSRLANDDEFNYSWKKIEVIASALREERRRVWEEAARQLDAINQPSRIGIMHRLRTLAAQWRHDAVSHE